MEPIFGFILYSICCIIVALVAKNKGRRGWAFLIASLLLGPAMVMLAAKLGATGSEAAWTAFAVPVIALLVAFGSKSGDDLAAEHGSYRGKKKCPFCAESIRAEAIKCKHCGANLSA